MGGCVVQLVRSEVRELLRSQATQDMLRGHGQEIAAATGIPYRVTTVPGRNRAHARVSTATREQYLDELREPRLVGATRGAIVTGQARSKDNLDRYRAGKSDRRHKAKVTAAKRRRAYAAKKATGLSGAARVLRAGMEVKRAERARRKAARKHQRY